MLAAAFVRVSVTGKRERVRRFGWLRDFCVLEVWKEKGMTAVIR